LRGRSSTFVRKASRDQKGFWGPGRKMMACPPSLISLQLHAKAGDGGAGCVSFRREAHVAKGGPTAATAERAVTYGLSPTIIRPRSWDSAIIPFDGRRMANTEIRSRKHGSQGQDQSSLCRSEPWSSAVKASSWFDSTARGPCCRGGRTWGQGKQPVPLEQPTRPSFADRARTARRTGFNLELKLQADVA